MTAAALRMFALSAVLPIAMVHIVARAEGGTIAVTGTVTAEGVPCRVLRGDDGTLYTFRRSRITNEFKAGDRIRIEGTITPASICQQGTTIVVTKADKSVRR
jgi:hypothetical protein